ncbi:zinc ribbon domain-containing protein [Chitinimonas lacunae]|uniref:Zinc ribbon domain-containing protein n=1 Tax=Chitinimonas lacunae TaxID=1963018 RepID=A0ABV8MVZ8_9NEIS
MALIKCKECNNEVSSKAKICPKCGAKVVKYVHPVATILVIGAAIWGVLIMAGGGGGGSVSSRTGRVSYQVEGTAPSAALTFSNAQGGTEQKVVLLPWNVDYPQVRPGTHLYLSAQNQGDSGVVRVRIMVDSKEMKTSESSGGYTIATASMPCC